MSLGLDLGTSSLKAIVIDASPQVLGEATAPLTVERPQQRWSAPDPAGWNTAAWPAMAALKTRADLSGIRGIGLAGQMQGVTLIGADGRRLRPGILWNASRSHAEAATLDADPERRRLTQLPRPVEGSAASGRLRDALAADWGLPKRVPVPGGAGWWR